MENATPTYSVRIDLMSLASAPVPAVMESPMAATTPMSPGRSSCALRGGDGDGPRAVQGNVAVRPDWLH